MFEFLIVKNKGLGKAGYKDLYHGIIIRKIKEKEDPSLLTPCSQRDNRMRTRFKRRE
jgi:hypothetical protein